VLPEKVALNMRAQLVPLDGGSPIDLPRDVTLVGRKEDCDLRLDHKSVSKLHCVIVKTDGLLLVRDLGSTNGTRVNGQRIRRAALLPGDKLTVAGFHYRILLGAAAEAGPSPDDHTMHMGAKEAVQLQKASQAAEPMGDSSADAPLANVQANELPDVYPDDAKRR
jgi:predicted component of type VI protein secretion system